MNHLGIDFGTSYCTMAALDKNTGRPITLMDREGNKKIPTVDFWSADGNHEKKGLPDCFLSVADRQALRGDIPWKVFSVLGLTLLTHDVEETLEKLNKLSGFEQIRQLLEKHFFQRSEHLQCHTVLLGILKLLKFELNNELYTYQTRIEREQEESRDYLCFMLSHPQAKKNPLVERFRVFLKKHFQENHSKELSAEIVRHLEMFENLQFQLESVQKDIEGLHLLEENPELVNEDEKQELFRIFGQEGECSRASLCVSKCAKRHFYWSRARQTARNAKRIRLAENANYQYSCRLSLLSTQEEENIQ